MREALKNGLPIHIKVVERGRACDCTCPGCGENLIAKQGKINISHFAHQALDSECRFGFEAMLNIHAKDILEKQQQILLPKLSYLDTIHYKQHERTICNAQSIHGFDNIELENRFHKFIPNILITKNNRKLAIKLWLNHEIKEYDNPNNHDIAILTIKIRGEEVSTCRESTLTIEVVDISIDKLTNIIASDFFGKKWIKNPRIDIFIRDELPKIRKEEEAKNAENARAADMDIKSGIELLKKQAIAEDTTLRHLLRYAKNTYGVTEGNIVNDLPQFNKSIEKRYERLAYRTRYNVFLDNYHRNEYNHVIYKNTDPNWWINNKDALKKFTDEYYTNMQAFHRTTFSVGLGANIVGVATISYGLYQNYNADKFIDDKKFTAAEKAVSDRDIYWWVGAGLMVTGISVNIFF